MAEGYYAMKSIAKPSTVVSFDDDEQAELVRQQEFKTIRSLFIECVRVSAGRITR